VIGSGGSVEPGAFVFKDEVRTLNMKHVSFRNVGNHSPNDRSYPRINATRAHTIHNPRTMKLSTKLRGVHMAILATCFRL
jgi:hypothetical protein